MGSPGGPLRRPSPWRTLGALGTAALLVASLACGCGTQPAPSPTPAATPTATTTASPAVTASPAPTLSPTPTYADTLRVGWNPGDAAVFRGAPIAWAPSISFASVVYSALYRWDATYGPVSDLADGPCLPQADPKVLRCRLVETTFQDGTPLTADDVAYTFQLDEQTGLFPTLELKEVRVVDPRTVDFVLSAVDPTFLTEVLPTVPILPRHGVEAAYADFLGRAKGLTSAGLQKLVDTIHDELGREPPVCSTARRRTARAARCRQRATTGMSRALAASASRRS